MTIVDLDDIYTLREKGLLGSNELLELATAEEALQVAVATNVTSADEDLRHSRLASLFREVGLDVLALAHFIEFDDANVLDLERLERLLGALAV